MKKSLLGILLAMALLLAACSSGDNAKGEVKKDSEEHNTTEETSNEEETNVEEETSSEAENEEDALAYEVTIPASFLEGGEDISKTIADAKADGIEEVIENDDGSLTYKMTKSTHEKLIQEMRDDIIEYVDEVINDEEFPSIHDIEYSEDFSEFTLIVDREAYEDSFDSLVMLGFTMSSVLHYLYSGGDLEEFDPVFHVKDEKTGEIFDSSHHLEEDEDVE